MRRPAVEGADTVRHSRTRGTPWSIPSSSASVPSSHPRSPWRSFSTEWSAEAPAVAPGEPDAVFPLSILKKTSRGDLIQVGKQVNGCFVNHWHDACAVMMRRLIETAIIGAFEASGIDSKIKTPRGDFFQLSDLIDAALAESSWNLGRGTKAALPKVKDLGHPAAHARRYTTQRSEIERVQQGYRQALEEFLSRAGLLTS